MEKYKLNKTSEENICDKYYNKSYEITVLRSYISNTISKYLNYILILKLTMNIKLKLKTVSLWLLKII